MLTQKDVDLTFEKQQMSLHFFSIPLNIDVSIQFDLNCHHLVKKCLHLMAADLSFIDATCENSHLFNESKRSCA